MLISRPSVDSDTIRDEIVHSLFDGRARYKVDDLPDEAKVNAWHKRRTISLGTCAGQPNA